MINRDGMLAHVRYLTNDQDSALSDAQIYSLLNEAGNIYFTLFTPRAFRVVGTGTGSATGEIAFPSIGSGTAFFDTDINNIAKLLNLSLESPGIADAIDYHDGPPLERIDIGKLYAMRKYQGTTSGIPKYWAAWRKAADSDANSGKWRIAIHPPSNNANRTLSGTVELEWVDMTGSTDVPNVSYSEVYEICRLAAIQAAYLLGRSREYIAAMRRLVPAHIKAALGIIERQLAPREPRESPA